MPFQRPTLPDLIAQGEAEIEASLPGADASLRRTVLGVLVRVFAGAVHGLYGFLAWLALQLFTDTVEEDGLIRRAGIWNILTKAGGYAAGNVDFTGTDTTLIAKDTKLRRADGIEYLTTAEVTINAGVATAPVKAILAGTAGLADAGLAVNLVSPIAGVNSAATVAAGGLVGGVDQESVEGLRTRLKQRIQEPPHGGADFDYETWAKENLGVTRAWAYPLELGIGTVTVRFMMDDTYADGIPLAGDVTTVQDYIDAVRPVTVKGLYVVAPVAVPLNLTITGLNPATGAVKDAIESELTDLIKREAVPGGPILISHIREAISIAAGESDHALTVPAADVTHTTGQIATMGAITWV